MSRPRVAWLAVGAATVALVLGSAGPAGAQAGEWRIGGRVLEVSTRAETAPFGSGQSVIGIDDALTAAFDISTLVTDQWEVAMTLTTAPHDLAVTSGGLEGLDVGRTWIAQSVITLRYHVPLWGRWSPYVGAGVGLAWLHSSDTTDSARAAGIAELRSDALTGVAAQAGVTYRYTRRWMFTADITYSGAEGEVRLVDGDGATTARLDTPLHPWLAGVGAVYRF